MRNDEWAAFQDFREELRSGAALELLGFWQDPASRYRLGRIHASIDTLSGLRYSRGVTDELDRAAAAAHRMRGDRRCGCGRARCGSIPVPLGDTTSWEPPPAPTRARRSPAAAAPPAAVPVADPPPYTPHGDLVDLAALFAGDFIDPSLDALFPTDGDLAARCGDRMTLLAVRWATRAPDGPDIDFTDEDLDRFLDARPVKTLKRTERHLRIGQYARFAAMAAPPEPFTVAGASSEPRPVIWWVAPGPVELQGRVGRWIAVVAGSDQASTALFARRDALEAAAHAGHERFDEEFLAAFAPNHTGAVVARHEGARLMIGKTPSRTGPWVPAAQPLR